MSITRAKGLAPVVGKFMGASAEKEVGWVVTGTSDGSPVGTTAENEFDVLVAVLFLLYYNHYQDYNITLAVFMYWSLKLTTTS